MFGYVSIRATPCGSSSVSIDNRAQPWYLRGMTNPRRKTIQHKREFRGNVGYEVPRAQHNIIQLQYRLVVIGTVDARVWWPAHEAVVNAVWSYLAEDALRKSTAA
ncbi:hypothetical protein LCGC14_0850370, partial [marine sediment metagenome]